MTTATILGRIGLLLALAVGIYLARKTWNELREELREKEDVMDQEMPKSELRARVDSEGDKPGDVPEMQKLQLERPEILEGEDKAGAAKAGAPSPPSAPKIGVFPDPVGRSLIDRLNRSPITDGEWLALLAAADADGMVSLVERICPTCQEKYFRPVQETECVRCQEQRKTGEEAANR